MSDQKTARLYRMVMPKHICPFGQKSKWLLEKHGYTVEDRLLKTRDDVDAVKSEYNVKTTPQTFIGGERIGGYDDLRAYLDVPLPDRNAVTYRPVLMIFAVAFLMAVAMGLWSDRSGWWVIPHFASVAMVLLGLQKLQDVEGFSNMFLNYDLLGQKWVPYAYLYPFLETGAGLLMIAGVLNWLSGPVALIIGGVGAWSVFRAVYLQKRELKCACVGGGSNVPLGFVSLTENLVMVAMGVLMIGMLFAG